MKELIENVGEDCRARQEKPMTVIRPRDEFFVRKCFIINEIWIYYRLNCTFYLCSCKQTRLHPGGNQNSVPDARASPEVLIFVIVHIPAANTFASQIFTPGLSTHRACVLLNPIQYETFSRPALLFAFRPFRAKPVCSAYGGGLEGNV